MSCTNSRRLPAPISIDYAFDQNSIAQHVQAGQFSASSSMALCQLVGLNGFEQNPAGLWNYSRLLGICPQVPKNPERPTLSVVDLFCGCGGLSLGVRQAAESVGVRPIFRLAVDLFEPALRVYSKNLRPLKTLRQNILNLIDYHQHDQDGLFVPNMDTIHLDDEIEMLVGNIDLLIAGPPCEGNSNLNNKTRRADHRNELYLVAIAIGIALKAKVIVVENVETVRHSQQNVVERSIQLLKNVGYFVAGNGIVLRSSDFGTPQQRKRHFLIASTNDCALEAETFSSLTLPQLTVKDAIEDLRHIPRASMFDQPSQLSPANQKRVDYLIQNKLFDLPDQERPDCHKLKDHSYGSVYGRMHPDRVAPTITKGFLCPGRGRFTHPIDPRSLTPHEGARLQGFPEDFKWLVNSDKIKRGDYAAMIGDAVPPQLGSVMGLAGISLIA